MYIFFITLASVNNNLIMKNLITLVLFWIAIFGISAQNSVMVHTTDGNDAFFKIDEVDYMSFEQVVFDEAGGVYSEWSYIDIPNYPVGTSWTYSNSGDIDLSAYAQKNVQLAFHYKGDAIESATWEIKNMYIGNDEALVYSDELTTSDCGFTFEYAEASAGEPVWSFDALYGLKATSYSHVTETRTDASVKAISPVLKLEDNCVLRFDHVYRYTSTPSEDFTLAVRLVYKAPAPAVKPDDTPEDNVIYQPNTVDLGLSVLWADFNLGASHGLGIGTFYSWGEVSPQMPARYYWDSYLHCYGTEMYTDTDCATELDVLKDYVLGGEKYDADKGIVSSKYDAASFNLGNGWRMPTLAEFEELMNPENCEWIWVTFLLPQTEEIVYGYRVRSLKEGYTDNYIFLPAGGFKKQNYYWYVGARGNYWSASPSGTAFQAKAIDIREDNRITIYNCMRSTGFNIRPVKSKPE